MRALLLLYFVIASVEGIGTTTPDDVQDFNSCRCGCSISSDSGVIVAERHPFCTANYSVWEINSSDKDKEKEKIRLKILPLLHQRKNDLLLIFDGLSRGNALLYDSRLPEKFHAEFLSSGSSARIEYKTRFSDLEQDSLFRGVIIYFEFLDESGASLKSLEHEEALKTKSPFLIIFIFIGIVCLAGFFLWLCFLRRKSSASGGGSANPGAEKLDEDADYFSPTFLAANSEHPAIVVITPQRSERLASVMSGFDLSEKALLSQASTVKETRNVGIQLSSPALFLKHFHPSRENLDSARGELHQSSSGRGGSPPSLDNLDFEYDEEDFLGGGPRLDPLQTVVIS